ncbi:MAG: choice-of-anchor D domain-containing protein [Myxococcota bacterium]
MSVTVRSLLPMTLLLMLSGCGSDDASTGDSGGSGGSGGSTAADAGDSGGTGGTGGVAPDGSVEDGGDAATEDATSDASAADADAALGKHLSIEPASHVFDQVPISAAGDQVFTIANDGSEIVTGITVTLDADEELSLDVADHCSQPMAPGASCPVTVTYTPNDLLDDAVTLRVTADDGIEVTASIEGQAPEVAPGLELAPASLAFGTLPLQTQSSAKVVTVTNTGSSTLGDLWMGLASGSHFALDDLGCSQAPLAPGDSCKVAITFAPLVAGSHADQLQIAYDGYSPATVQLSGEGVHSDLSAPPSVQLGPVDINGGLTHVALITVTNTGSAAVGPIDPAAVTSDHGDHAFAISTDGCVGQTLNPHDICSIEVMFSPVNPGRQLGQARITSAAHLAVTQLVGFTKDIWVDVNNGSNNNDGLSEDAPVDTLTQALDLSDERWNVHVAPGTYTAFEVFPLLITGQNLIGDAADPPQIVPTGQVEHAVNIPFVGGFLSNFVIDVRNASPMGARSAAVDVSVSSSGSSEDDARLSNIELLLGSGWDGVDVWGSHASTQVALLDSTVTCATGDSVSYAFKAGGDGYHAVRQTTVTECADGVIAAGGITLQVGSTDLSGCTRDSIRVEGSYGGADMIDLGQYNPGGQNNLAGIAPSHVGLNVLTTPGNGVRLNGNTWKASVQGADASGLYGTGTIAGPVDRVGGNNYAIASGASIQFVD